MPQKAMQGAERDVLSSVWKNPGHLFEIRRLAGEGRKAKLNGKSS
jgi:hypothetical protein